MVDEPVVCVQERITRYSALYGVDPEISLGIARCESNFNPTVIGDFGLAYGTYQFHLDTFILFSKEMGERLEYDSIDDNIKLGVWSFAHGKLFAWTCARKLGYTK